MARKARVEFDGALYHVLDRGDRREAIFRDEGDRERFLATLGEVCARTGWRVHAFVLMTNHYHLLLETPQPNLVAGMRWFQTTTTARFNRRHRLSGHLYQGRYKAVVVGARQLLAEGLRCLGLESAELALLKKNDVRKAALAATIRAGTAVSNRWIAETLHLGHVSRVSHCTRPAPAALLKQLAAAVPAKTARL
jgi:REP element-mobilizing transposase RayT